MEGPILLVLCSGFSLMRGWDTVGAQAWRPYPLTHPQPEGAWGGSRESRPSSWLPSLDFFFFSKSLGIFKGLFSEYLLCSPRLPGKWVRGKQQ